MITDNDIKIMSNDSSQQLSVHPSWNVYESYMESKYIPYWIQTTTMITYKCRFGRMCEEFQCSYLHPGEAGYRSSPYLQSTTPCQYETDVSACRLKCGESNGRYCPFLHCKHASMEFISIRCPRPDCQRHCPHCI